MTGCESAALPSPPRKHHDNVGEISREWLSVGPVAFGERAQICGQGRSRRGGAASGNINESER